ncbi:MAG: hypothetical protein ABFS45_05235 [Pseudomonadota bacterium]
MSIPFKNHYTNRPNQVNPFLADHIPVWIVTHMPLFVVTKEYTEKTYEIPLPRDALFDSVLVVGEPAPIEKIPVVLSGHSHRAQLVNPQVSNPAVQDVRRPLEYVIGISGVNLSGSNPDSEWAKVNASWVRLPSSNKNKWQVISEKWHLQRKKKFGFLSVQVTSPEPGGYQAKFHVTFYDIKEGWLSDDGFVDCTISSDNPFQLVCPDN